MEEITNYLNGLKTIPQFAKIENVSHQYIYKLINKSIIVPVNIAGVKFIDICKYKHIKSVEKYSNTQTNLTL